MIQADTCLHYTTQKKLYTLLLLYYVCTLTRSHLDTATANTHAQGH
jgi:hypothetical protein